MWQSLAGGGLGGQSSGISGDTSNSQSVDSIFSSAFNVGGSGSATLDNTPRFDQSDIPEGGGGGGAMNPLGLSNQNIQLAILAVGAFAGIYVLSKIYQ